MSKKEEKPAVEKKKLEKKQKEQEDMIKERVAEVKKITAPYTQPNSETPQMVAITKKFEQSYEKRKEFSEELLKSRQNCNELKSKINKFVRQQNMLMIKLKSSMAKGKSD
jgi:hypothetical protein